MQSGIGRRLLSSLSSSRRSSTTSLKFGQRFPHSTVRATTLLRPLDGRGHQQTVHPNHGLLTTRSGRHNRRLHDDSSNVATNLRPQCRCYSNPIATKHHRQDWKNHRTCYYSNTPTRYDRDTNKEAVAANRPVEDGSDNDDNEVDDIYDKYRVYPPTYDIWKNVIEDENEYTKDQLVHNDSELYYELRKEMNLSISNYQDYQQGEQSAELGPTGKYYYSFIIDSSSSGYDSDVDGGGHRIYQRHPTQVMDGVDGDASGNDDVLTWSTSQLLTSPYRQIVLEIDNPDIVLHKMSLSVDETLLAYMIADESTNEDDSDDSKEGNDEDDSEKIRRKKQIYVCHIDAGTEMILEIPTSHAKRLASIEFGPIVQSIEQAEPQASGDGEIPPTPQPDFYHTMYYVTTDNLGRPNTVHCSYIDPETLEIVSISDDDTDDEGSAIYHNDDPTVWVDVQRTKGCQYVAIQAMTKTSNEIYLCDGTSHRQDNLILIRKRQHGVQYHVDVGTTDDVILLASIENDENTSGVYSELSLVETSMQDLPLPNTREDLVQRIDKHKMLQQVQQEEEQIQDRHIINDMDLFKKYLVLYERSTVDGRQRIRVLNRIDDGGDTLSSISTILPLSDEMNTNCSKISPAGNMYYNSKSFQFTIESPIQPPSLYHYDFETKNLKKITNNSDAEPSKTATPESEYHQERVMIPSHDGTMIPMSLVYLRRQHQQEELQKQQPDDEADSEDTSSSTSLSSKMMSWFGKDKKQTKKQPSNHSSRQRPVVLIGYGAYGEPVNLGYDPTLIPLLQRDYVIAYAHVRGGSDLGKSWYHAGRLHNKVKAIEDFVSCAQAIRDGSINTAVDTTSGNVALEFDCNNLTAKAYSAGGVIVGASVNTRPDLFDNVVFTNAFLDVNYSLNNPELFLTEHEYEEYGNPTENSNIAAIIQSYCPVTNVPSIATSEDENPNQHYPKLLLIGTIDDENVPYWNSVTMVQKVRDDVWGQQQSKKHHKISRQNVLLHIEDGGGHELLGGDRRIRIATMEASFIIGNNQ